MRLTKRGVYGLRTMTGFAAVYDEGWVPLSRIAATERLSLAFLEQLTKPLRDAGLLASSRGARGGYRLTASPREITVGSVVRALEGPIALVECASEAQECSCDRRDACTARLLGLKLRDSVAGILDTTTLADLLVDDSIAPRLGAEVRSDGRTLDGTND